MQAPCRIGQDSQEMKQEDSTVHQQESSRPYPKHNPSRETNISAKQSAHCTAAEDAGLRSGESGYVNEPEKPVLTTKVYGNKQRVTSPFGDKLVNTGSPLLDKTVHTCPRHTGSEAASRRNGFLVHQTPDMQVP